MALIEYDDRAATAFATSRHVPRDGLGDWRDAVDRHLAPKPGMRLLDVGAGTGAWAAAFTAWFGLHAVAVEPSAAMRVRSLSHRQIGGDATALPFAADTFDGAWLSTVIHHIADIPAAAAELRRVLRDNAPVLIRGALRGRPDGVTLFRYFPEAVRALEAFPSADELRAVFTAAGFRYVCLEPVPQVTADSLRTVADELDRDAHTPLKLISDAEFEAGAARLRAAARVETGPVVDRLDLLVFC